VSLVVFEEGSEVDQVEQRDVDGDDAEWREVCLNKWPADDAFRPL
jgi:hypothetical protein